MSIWGPVLSWAFVSIINLLCGKNACLTISKQPVQEHCCKMIDHRYMAKNVDSDIKHILINKEMESKAMNKKIY